MSQSKKIHDALTFMGISKDDLPLTERTIEDRYRQKSKAIINSHHTHNRNKDDQKAQIQKLKESQALILSNIQSINNDAAHYFDGAAKKCTPKPKVIFNTSIPKPKQRRTTRTTSTPSKNKCKQKKFEFDFSTDTFNNQEWSKSNKPFPQMNTEPFFPNTGSGNKTRFDNTTSPNFDDWRKNFNQKFESKTSKSHTSENESRPEWKPSSNKKTSAFEAVVLIILIPILLFGLLCSKILKRTWDFSQTDPKAAASVFAAGCVIFLVIFGNCNHERHVARNKKIASVSEPRVVTHTPTPRPTKTPTPKRIERQRSSAPSIVYRKATNTPTHTPTPVPIVKDEPVPRWRNFVFQSPFQRRSSTSPASPTQTPRPPPEYGYIQIHFQPWAHVQVCMENRAILNEYAPFEKKRIKTGKYTVLLYRDDKQIEIPDVNIEEESLTFISVNFDKNEYSVRKEK